MQLCTAWVLIASCCAQADVKLPAQFTLSGRYAAALYMSATKAGKLPQVEKELSEVGFRDEEIHRSL